jgi:hypothetical protein
MTKLQRQLFEVALILLAILVAVWVVGKVCGL